MKVVVITGTAGPFDRLVHAMSDYAVRHPEAEVWVQHGPAPAPAPPASGAAFVDRDDVLTRMEQASAVVCHGGSGSIQDAIRAGHVPVLMPRLKRHAEHVDDHQLDVARAMADAGRALLLSDGTAASLDHAIAEAAKRRGPPQPDRSSNFVATVADAVEAAVAGAATGSASETRMPKGPRRPLTLATLARLARSLVP